MSDSSPWTAGFLAAAVQVSVKCPTDVRGRERECVCVCTVKVWWHLKVYSNLHEFCSVMWVWVFAWIYVCVHFTVMHACIQKSTNTWCTKVIFVQIIIPKLPVCIHILNRNLDTSNNTCIIRKQPNFMQEYVLCSDLLTPSNTLCVCMCVCVCVCVFLSVERERERAMHL